MRFDLITLFPGFFAGPLHYGVLERALRSHLAEVHTHDLRHWTHDRHRTVDDRPFGGGEGMVLKPQPIFDCADSLGIIPKATRDTARESVILLSAQGRRFTQSTARRLATLDRIVLICGRYEGVDERVAQLLADQELSLGDFVLSGGELAAAAIIDAVTRLLPGVLGHEDSSRYESFGLGDDLLDFSEGKERDTHQNCHVERSLAASSRGKVEGPASTPDPRRRTQNSDGHPERNLQNLNCHPEERSDEGPASPPDHEIRPQPPRSTHSSGGLLDYPHYTRPATFRGAAIPDVLQNGDHAAIRRWRRHAALAKTLANRPDLLAAAQLTDDDRDFLAQLDSSPES